MAVVDNATVGWIEVVADSLGRKESVSGHAWICATACAALVGLSGLFPILLLPNQGPMS
jgi:hypothetical protein